MCSSDEEKHVHQLSLRDDFVAFTMAPINLRTLRFCSLIDDGCTQPNELHP